MSVKSFGGACTEDYQCDFKLHLRCNRDSLTCACANNLYEWKNGKCEPKNPLKYGEACRKENEILGICVEKHTECMTEKCECFNSMIRKDGECRFRKYLFI